MAKWEFQANPSEEEEGLGHAGIETFKGAPYSGIARECSQNSLDAAAHKPDGSSEQVHLVFRLLLVARDSVPSMDQLQLTLEACSEHAENRNQLKARDFFGRAIAVAGQARIAVLLIEDYGTTGLLGPARVGMPFHALVKSSGVSQKADDTAGGSFGIGKNAAFAISGLRTVFYSTRYQDGPETVSLAQGKSILISHIDSDGPKRATGYWFR